MNLFIWIKYEILSISFPRFSIIKMKFFIKQKNTLSFLKIVMFNFHFKVEEKNIIRIMMVSIQYKYTFKAYCNPFINIELLEAK